MSVMPNIRKLTAGFGMAAGVLLYTVAPAASQAAAFLNFMEKSCVDAGPDMQARLTWLDEWRLADPKELDFVANFVTDSVARSLRVAGRISDTDPAGHGAMRRQKADPKLKAAVDSDNPARILMHKTNGFLALYLETEGKGDTRAVTCHLLMRGPNEDLAKDLAARFPLLPVSSGENLRVWSMVGHAADATTRNRLERGLTLHMSKEGKPQIAVLSYVTRAWSR